MSTAVWSTGGLEWRLLGPADLQGMHALHLESVAGVAPQAVKPETRAFLQSLLEGRGRVLGGWSGEQLVAYGVLQHDLLPEDAPRELLGLPPRAGLCKLAGAAVHPAWRGGGLQRWLIQQRIALAGDCAVFATAAPCNLPSWHNLLAAGLMVRGLQYRYGGHALPHCIRARGLVRGRSNAGARTGPGGARPAAATADSGLARPASGRAT